MQNSLQRAEIFVKQMTELAFFIVKCCLNSSIFYAKSCQKTQNKAYIKLSYEICVDKKRTPKRAQLLNLFKSMSDENHTLFHWKSLELVLMASKHLLKSIHDFLNQCVRFIIFIQKRFQNFVKLVFFLLLPLRNHINKDKLPFLSMIDKFFC